MPKVEITIKCLCMYVRDEEGKVVHVLTPATGDCHAGGVVAHDASATMDRRHAGTVPAAAETAIAARDAASAAPKHTTRLVWGEKERGPVIDGWALVLGNDPGSADTSLKVAGEEGKADRAVLVDLTEFTHGMVPRSFVQDVPNPAVAARLTLRSGRLTFVDSDGVWDFGNQEVPIAHEATWEMEVDDLHWVSIGASSDQWMPSLANIGADPEDGVYRFTIRSWAEPAGYDAKTTLSEAVDGKVPLEEVAKHFAAFYTLVEGAQSMPVPKLVRSEAELQTEDGEGKLTGPGYGVACRSASSKLAPDTTL